MCSWAGLGLAAFNGDDQRPQDTAFYWPLDLEFAPDGRPYILDWQSHRVRRIDNDGRVRTVIGSDFPGDGPPDGSDVRPPGAPGSTVELNHPTDLAFTSDGLLLLAAWHNHKIRRFDPATGLVDVVCGAGPGDRAHNVPLPMALLNQPKSLVVSTDGTIYVADSRNQRIRRIDAAGVITTVAGTGMVGFVGDDGPPLQAQFSMQEDNENPQPGGSLAVDGQGRLYLADTYNQRIRRIDLTANTVTTIAGNGTMGFGGDGGPATAASLNRPRDLEIGPDGRLYIADTDNDRVRVVDLTTGVISTIAGGAGRGNRGDDGPAAQAQLNRPFGLAFDQREQLYIADTFNNRIRRMVLP